MLCKMPLKPFRISSTYVHTLHTGLTHAVRASLPMPKLRHSRVTFSGALQTASTPVHLHIDYAKDTYKTTGSNPRKPSTGTAFYWIGSHQSIAHNDLDIALEDEDGEPQTRYSECVFSIHLSGRVALHGLAPLFKYSSSVGRSNELQINSTPSSASSQSLT